jgi:hypothetical protein
MPVIGTLSDGGPAIVSVRALAATQPEPITARRYSARACPFGEGLSGLGWAGLVVRSRGACGAYGQEVLSTGRSFPPGVGGLRRITGVHGQVVLRKALVPFC